MSKKKVAAGSAMAFIFLMGIVSLFSDMTHEGARSILGAYLSLAGASAAVIGFVSGLGEFLGYSLRLVSGVFADRTKKYWPMTIVGYIIDVMAIPALALVPRGGWIAACGLMIVERIGKAIKKPAKDTLLSFAATQNGVGKSFAIDWIKERYMPSEVSVTLLIVREDWDDIRSKEQYELDKEEVLPILRESADTLSGFSVATEVRFGRAGEEILRFAEEQEIDTIVMTKSTKPGWIQMIGSVTNHVVKYAKCVVVIVPEMQAKHK